MVSAWVKTIALFQIGKQPLTEGMNILCAILDLHVLT